MSESKEPNSKGSGNITLNANQQIKIVGVVFLISGVLGILYSIYFIGASPGTSYTEDGTAYKALPGARELVSESIPEQIYYGIALFIGILSILYLIEGGLLLNYPKNRFIFWFGIILSLFLLPNLILGTILGILNISLLWKNKQYKGLPYCYINGLHENLEYKNHEYFLKEWQKVPLEQNHLFYHGEKDINKLKEFNL